MLAANWLAEGVVGRTTRRRFRSVFTSAPALVFISFFLLHVIGLLWTDDLAWGTDLGRILFPVLVFTTILAGSEHLSASELRIILLFGAWSAVACGLFGIIFHDGKADDYRALSMFISHIRLALLLCLAVVILIYYRSARQAINLFQWCGALLGIYLIARLESLQGFAILSLTAMVLLWRWSRTRPSVWHSSLRALLIAAPLGLVVGAYALIEARHRPVPPGLSTTLELTAGGEPYYHDTVDTQTENGTHVWTYLAWREMRRAWKLRSERTLDDADDKGHALWSTAARYLASKGARKDSVSIMALTDAEVRAIEAGSTNVLQGQRGPLRERVEEVLFELDMYRSKGIASGHSVAMRIEFQKAGWELAKENWLTGVGTGDTQLAFDVYYERTNSALDKRWRLRAHNEYLTLWISFGVFGLVWSLITWWWPAYRQGAWKKPLFIAWAIAFGVSCLTDDTIETQAGATFFALYYALFVFATTKTDEEVPSRVRSGSG